MCGMRLNDGGIYRVGGRNLNFLKKSSDFLEL
jgi:hypothetical protein